MKITAYSYIGNGRMFRNENCLLHDENFCNFADFIKLCYRTANPAWPKFFKMDNLSKLGFVASEILLKDRDFATDCRKEDIGIVLCNSSSTLDTDTVFQESITDRANYFPSPSVFVYTLPNITIGEICIRNGFFGENALWISEEFDPEMLFRQTKLLFDSGSIQAGICGYVNVDNNQYEAFMLCIEKNARGSDLAFETESISRLYKSLSSI
jgi:hypothetical protein